LTTGNVLSAPKFQPGAISVQNFDLAQLAKIRSSSLLVTLPKALSFRHEPAHAESSRRVRRIATAKSGSQRLCHHDPF
jgi:hypothetical protein